MSEADTDGYTDIAFSPQAGDERLYVVFRHEPIRDEKASAEQGRPIFRDVEVCEIKVPGDKSLCIVEPVTKTHIARFRRQYEAFKTGGPEALTGTPLVQWPAITRGQVMELQHFGVKTVEQLAGLSDSNAQNIGPVLALRDKARDFVAQAKGEAPLQKMREELKAKDNELQTLRRMLEEQAKGIAEIRKKQKREADQ